MAIKALFIGLDKYLDSDIRELTGAVKDATALWALFSDSVPGIDATLLCNEQATHEKITHDLQACLTSAAADDIVIISFSGHGTRHHHLVTHNTSLKAIDDTTIGIEEIARLFKGSPAKAILFIMDCCFSGAAPARVVEETPIPRDGFSYDILAGTGRIMIAASSADQPCYELPGQGHGILTKAIIDVFKSEEGHVSLPAAIDKVMHLVRAEAARIGVTQTPVSFGMVEGGLIFPVLTPGKNYYAAFPESKGATISATIKDLKVFGIPDPIISEWARNFKSGLNGMQLEAVNKHRILEDRSLLVVAPTSSGKTFIGEMAAAKAISNGKKVVFLLPYRALVNEKYDSFVELYAEKLGIRVIRCTGDYFDQTVPFVRGKYEIAILTFEMFLNLVLGNPFLLTQIGLIVLDEAQFITDPSRGITVELLLTFLLANAEKGIKPQLIALSAVIGNVNEFDRWLGIDAMISTVRPVPLQEGVMDRTGEYRIKTPTGETKNISLVPQRMIVQRGKTPSQQDLIVPLLKVLMQNPKEKVIIFRNMRGSAEGCAGYLAHELGLSPALGVVEQLPNHDLSTTSTRLRECLAGGTAFHNTNMNRIEKATIERSFRDPAGSIRVLVATTTLAAGINTPASTVILAEQGFVGEEPRAFTVAEFKNMAGRAGRLGFNEEGKAIILAENTHETQQLFNRYVMGSPEALRSSFETRDLETWIIRLLAQVQKILRKNIAQLLANTYGGYLENKKNPSWRANMEQHLEEKIKKMISLGLLEQEGDLIQLTPLGRACGKSSLTLESTMRLIELLRSCKIAKISSQDLMAIVQALPESDATYTPIFKRGTKESEMPGMAAQRLGHDVIGLLQRYSGDLFCYYARCKRAAVLYDWIHGVPTETIEQEYTMNPYQGKVGYGDIRHFVDATRYHLRTAAPIALLILLEKCPSGATIEALLNQLEHGIPEDALGLLEIPIDFERGEYLALCAQGFKSAATFWSAPRESLGRVLSVKRCAEIERARTRQGL